MNDELPWPDLPMWVWISPASRLPFASFDTPSQHPGSQARTLPSPFGEGVPLRQSAGALSTLHFRARAGINCMTMEPGSPGIPKAWPEIDLWLAVAGADVLVSVTKVQRSCRTSVPVPRSLPWCEALRKGTEELAADLTGYPPGKRALDSLFAMATAEKLESRELARRDAASKVVYPEYTDRTEVSIRTVSAGLPTLGR